MGKVQCAQNDMLLQATASTYQTGRAGTALRRGSAIGVLVLFVLLGILLLRGRGAVASVRTVALGQPTRGQTVASLGIDPRTGHAVVVTNSSGNGANFVSTVDVATGTLLKTSAVGPGLTAVSPATRRGLIFISTSGLGGDGRVTLVRSRAGTVDRTVALPQDPGAIAIDEQIDRAFVVGVNGTALNVLDARTGAMLRTVTVGKNGNVGTSPQRVAVDTRTGRVFVVNSNDNTVSVLDARTGRLLRNIPVGAFPISVAVDERTSRAFVLTIMSRTISVIDTATGRIVRTEPLAAPAATLAIDPQRSLVFVPLLSPPFSGAGSHVEVLDARSGRMVRMLAVEGTATAIGVDGRHGRLFVAIAAPEDRRRNLTGPARVSIFDTQRGAVIQTVPVVADPFAVAVDERTGYALVASTGSASAPGDSWGWVPAWLRGRLPFLGSKKAYTAPPATVSVIAPTQ